MVPGSNTQSGLPLLANDPHLGLSAPAVWYFAGLHAPAGQFADGQAHAALDVVGATLPGLPFVVLGRTNKAAWGFTNTGPDVQDLYLEALEGKDNYRTPMGQQAFETRNEVIKVKGQGDVSIKVRSTRHGPVISDVQPAYAQFLNMDKYAIALRWTDSMASWRTTRARSVPTPSSTRTLFSESLAGLSVSSSRSATVAQAVMRPAPLRSPCRRRRDGSTS